jgi:hypothetical protein
VGGVSNRGADRYTNGDTGSEETANEYAQIHVYAQAAGAVRFVSADISAVFGFFEGPRGRFSRARNGA